MSLEAAILSHAEALRSLAHAIHAAAGTDVKLTGVVAATGATSAPADTDKAAVAAAAPKSKGAEKAAEKPAETKPAKAKPSTDSAAAGAVSYEEVRNAVLTLSKEKGREVASALLSRYGATKGTDILPDAYPKFMDDVARINAGTYDPIAGEQDAEAELA
jgi:pyruvate/2-oxoglutarate dehydrogenase complex dihydrolipoamide acyltransferase (E2) component